MHRLRLLLAFAIFIAPVSSSAQQQPFTLQQIPFTPHSYIGPPARIDDILRSHNIEITEPSLILALKNPDDEVRGIASLELQEMNAPHAFPAIKKALETEQAPRARNDMALALGHFGDFAELKKQCADEKFPTEFRLYAVGYMFDLRVYSDETCLRAAEEIVQQFDSDFRTPTYRAMALPLLIRFQGLNMEESSNVLKLVTDRLKDPEPAVRSWASLELAEWGNMAAVPYLQAAIAKEQDARVLSYFQDDLKDLRQGLKPTPQTR